MPFRGFLVLAVFLAFFLSLSPAKAEISDEGAAHLRSLFQGMLDQQKQQALVRHGELKTEGDIVVDKKDTYYAVQFPPTTFVGADHSRVAIGKIAVNAMPGDSPDLWKMAVAIPTPILIYEGDKRIMSLSLGAQSLIGVWNEPLANFVKLDSRIETIELKEETGRFNLKVPKIEARYDLNETTQGLWSGPMAIAVSGLSANSKSDDNVADGGVKIAEILLDYKIKDLSPQAMKTFREQMGAIAENAADPTAGQEASAQHLKAMYGLISQYLRTAFDTVSGDVRVKGLEITPAAKNDSHAFSLGEAGFGMDMAGFRSGAASLGFRVNYKDMKITPAPEEFGPLAPGEVQINLSVDQIPLHKILDLGKTAIESADSAETAAQIAMMQAAMTLPALLSESGTKITLKDNRVAGNLYEATLNGTAITKVGAAKGAIVNGRMEIVGMEEVISWLKANGGKDPEEQAQANQVLTVLTTLQMVGQQGTNASGKPSRTYDFVLDEKGQMLLNGTDINVLIQSMNGGGKAAQ